MKKIGIDIDDVLGEFISEFLKWYNNKNGGNFTANEIITWDIEKYIHRTKDDFLYLLGEFYESLDFSTLPMVEGSKDGLYTLNDMGNELIAITARWDSTKNVTENWLGANYGNLIKDLYFTVDKGNLASELGIDIHIDDVIHNASNIADKGIEVLLYNRPWNNSPIKDKNIQRVENWSEIMKYLK